MYPTRVAARSHVEAPEEARAADSRAIERVLAGEPAAYRAIVERHQRGVHAVIVRLIQDRADAEDLTQQAFLAAYDALGDFDRERRFSSWIYRIALNLAKDHLKARRRGEIPGGDAGEACAGTGARAMFAGALPEPEASAIAGERERLLERGLAYYRNNAIHLFVADGLVALALLGATTGGPTAERLVSKELLRARTLALSRLLKLEFSYRVGESFEAIFDATLARLVDAKLLAPDVVGDHAAGLRATEPARLALLAGQVRDFVESYSVAARALDGILPLAEKDLVRKIHDLGEKLYYTGHVRRREACVRANYQNAVAYFKERGVLVEQDKKLAVASVADARALAAEIAELLPAD